VRLFPAPASLGKIRRFIAAAGWVNFIAFAWQRLVGRLLSGRFRAASARRLRAWAAASGTAGASGQTYLILSTLDWRYPYRQRPRHLAKALADAGRRVVFVTPSTGYDRVMTIEPLAPNLALCASLEAALDALATPILLILSTDTRWSGAHLERAISVGGAIVYDYLDALDDSLSVSPITRERRALHGRLLRDEANVAVLSVAQVLDAEVARARRGGHAVVTNGVDLAPFQAARRGEALRADMAAVVARGKPIIGYYGSLAAWFDYDLMLALASACPNYEIVTIGPDLDGSSAALAARPANLSVLPGMDYVDLPRHGCWFDVCLVPFLINEITLATSPLKIFEYMAMGSPIVSTPMPECAKYASILIGRDREDFIAKVDEALRLRGDAAHRQLLAAEAGANTWSAKAAQVAALVAGLRR